MHTRKHDAPTYQAIHQMNKAAPKQKTKVKGAGGKKKKVGG